MRVAVLTGGSSAERQVSLGTGMQVAGALREAGDTVVTVDTARGVLSREEEDGIREAGVGADPPDLASLDALAGGSISELVATPALAAADVVFIALHGGAGEDGRIQALLELAGIPFVGSDHLGCALAMDKDVSKRLFRDAGIPTPGWRMAPVSSEEADTLGYPLVVKPNAEGSTVGLSVVREPGALEEAVAFAREYDERVMVERMVEGGREITVGIVAGEVLPVGEIIPEHEIFDYECKYQPGMAREIFPADLPEEAARRAQELSLRAHHALGIVDLNRVDFILDGEGVPWCLEANALPGLTSNSLVPKAAAAAGIAFPDLCHRLCALGARRWGGG